MNVLRTGTLDAGLRGGQIIGIQIVFGVKPDVANSWSGKACNAQGRRTSLGSITTQSASSLKLGGSE
jgi:hypothetical protein